MPLYEFKCRKCGLKSSTLNHDEQPICQLCSNPMGRDYSFFVKTPFQPHYNTAVGQYVRTQAEFESHLSRLSDAQTERTGILHNYQPVEIGDRDAYGATEEGMDDYYRTHHDNPTEPELID